MFLNADHICFGMWAQYLFQNSGHKMAERYPILIGTVNE